MPFVPPPIVTKLWRNRSEALTTPVSAEALIDSEQRGREDTREVGSAVYDQVFDDLVTSDETEPTALDPGRVHIQVDGSGNPTTLWIGVPD